MPVYRYRSVEEMEQPRWRVPGDPELYRAIARVWAFGRHTSRRRFPAGVHKHRSIDDLNQRTGQWAEANFRALHALRLPRI